MKKLETINILRIAIYARVSDENEIQSLNEQIEISKALIKSFCNRNNLKYEIVIILKEAPGTSGASSERPKFNELCNLIQNGKIDAIAAKESSRIGRDIGISEAFKKLVKKHNITLIIPGLEDGINSSTGELMYDFMSVLSSAERNRIVERTNTSIASLARTKKKVHGGTLPLGFEWISTGVIAPIPAEIKEVNFIFDTFLKTGTIKDTLELLKEAGIKTRSGKPCNRAYIERIIQNRKYISEYKVPCSPVEEFVTLDYPVQVPKNKFKEANDLLTSINKEFKRTTKKINRVYLLSGLLFTKEGNPLRATSGKGIPYYRCKEEDVSYYAKEIESGLINFLIQIRDSEDLKEVLVSKLIKTKKTVSPLENKRNQLLRKIKELNKKEEVIKEKLLTKNLTSNLINILDSEIIKIHDEMSLIKRELEDINIIEAKRQREFAETKTAVRNLYQAIPAILNRGKPEIIRGIFRQLIKRIIISSYSNEVFITWRVPHSSDEVTKSSFDITSVKSQNESAITKLLGGKDAPIEKSPLYSAYIIQGLSSDETAKKLGVQKSTVLKYLKSAGIQTRKKGCNKNRKRGVKYGQRFQKSGNEIELITEVKRIEIMRKMRKSNVTFQGIADHFNELGIPTKSGKGIWDRGTICRILKSSAKP